MNKRIMREIKNSMESHLFEFFHDTENIFGYQNACYIRFKPENTFDGQTHILRIRFEYGSNEIYRFPTKPPNIIFITPIYHTNIALGGAICLDVINDKWNPQYSIEAIFNSIIILLNEPNIKSPFNNEAAANYRKMSNNQYAAKTLAYYKHKLPASGDICLRLLEFEGFSKKSSLEGFGKAESLEGFGKAESLEGFGKAESLEGFGKAEKDEQ